MPKVTGDGGGDLARTLTQTDCARSPRPLQPTTHLPCAGAREPGRWAQSQVRARRQLAAGTLFVGFLQKPRHPHALPTWGRRKRTSRSIFVRAGQGQDPGRLTPSQRPPRPIATRTRSPCHVPRNAPSPSDLPAAMYIQVGIHTSWADDAEPHTEHSLLPPPPACRVRTSPARTPRGAPFASIFFNIFFY